MTDRSCKKGTMTVTHCKCWINILCITDNKLNSLLCHWLRFYSSGLLSRCITQTKLLFLSFHERFHCCKSQPDNFDAIIRMEKAANGNCGQLAQFDNEVDGGQITASQLSWCCCIWLLTLLQHSVAGQDWHGLATWPGSQQNQSVGDITSFHRSR